MCTTAFGVRGKIRVGTAESKVNSSSYILKLLTYHGKYKSITSSKLKGDRFHSLILEPCRRCY